MHERTDPTGFANPYAPPVEDGAPTFDAAEPAAADAGYRDQSKLVRVLTALLLLEAGARGMNVLSPLILNGVDSTSHLARVALRVSGLAASLGQILFLGTTIPFAMFLVRANKNARAMGIPPGQFTPASMVWWYFVPLLSFVRPYQAVRAVWDASFPEEPEEAAKPTSPVLPLWWAMWLSVQAWPYVMAFTARPGAVAVQNVLVAIDSALWVGLCGVAVGMVRALHDRQQRRAGESRG